MELNIRCFESLAIFSLILIINWFWEPEISVTRTKFGSLETWTFSKIL